MAATVSIVTLGVSDLGRATEFYTSLGFERSSVSVDGVVTFLRTPGPVLALWPSRDMADDVGVPVEGSGFRHVTLAMNVRSEDELDTTFAAWVATGAAPLKQPHEVFFGASSYVADLDGHIWELAYNRDFPFTPDGRLDLPV
jgi:predicted lactoylglutathione lyase